jgi:hypothetical protein
VLISFTTTVFNEFKKMKKKESTENEIKVQMLFYELMQLFFNSERIFVLENYKCLKRTN